MPARALVFTHPNPASIRIKDQISGSSARAILPIWLSVAQF